MNAGNKPILKDSTVSQSCYLPKEIDFGLKGLRDLGIHIINIRISNDRLSEEMLITDNLLHKPTTY